MRVLIAAVSAPSQLNGVSRHAANLARGLSSLAEAPEIHFVAGAWQQQMFADAGPGAHAKLHYHWIPLKNTSIHRVAWYATELPHVAAQIEADLVHYACPALLSSRAFRCPVLVSLHDLYPFDIPENFGLVKGAINRQLMRRCLRNASAIACVSESTRLRLSRWLGEEAAARAQTIPNAVEPFACSSGRAPYPLRQREPFLLCVAQHRRNKNIPLVLSIFDEALRQRVLPGETRLLVVGIQGPETPAIQRQMRALRIENKVVLMSGLSEAELHWCYRNSKLVLAPSRIEGFGLPVVEALIAGCPVVCSDIPAFREVGGDLCRYVAFEGDTVAAYAHAIREVVTEPRRPAAQFPGLSRTAVAAKFLALYRKLTGFQEVPQCGMMQHPDAWMGRAAR
jgi:glycosyltransferase involved in cell wall biosynthesis